MASRTQTRLDGDNELDIDEELDNLEQIIERCKVLYEQHFMGIQKVAPETLHRQIERRMLKLTQTRIRNTGQRFRFTTLSQKFGSYNTYWRRTMRAIEQGRYVPHLAAAARRAEREGKDMPEELLQKMPKRLREKLVRDRERVRERAERDASRRVLKKDGRSAKVRDNRPHQHAINPAEMEEVDFDAMFDAIRTDDKGRPVSAPEPAASKPAAPKPAAPKPAAPEPAAPKPAAAAPRRPRPAAQAKRDSQGNALPPGMTENDTRNLFDKFVKARKLVGERTDNVSYNKLLRTLNKQAPTIMKQHGAKAVEFNVVIKEDRVVLKAKPKK